jgi:hypothetical protein
MEQWLKENYQTNTRVLYEDYPHNYELDESIEHEITRLALVTDAHFISTYRLYGTFKAELDANCMDGFAFNQNFSSMNTSFFLDNLRSFNIQYIIGYSSEIRLFMNQNSQLFPEIARFSPFYVYNNTQFTNNHFILSTNNLSSFILHEINPIFLNYTGYNVNVNDTIQISFFDFPNWEVYLNDSQIIKEPTQKFITVKIPQSGNISLYIKWIKSPVETVGIVFNLIMIFADGIIVVIVFIKKKKE